MQYRTRRILGTIPLTGLLALSSLVSAGIRPSFNLDYSAWHASHILLVETTESNGIFKVQESWKGHLAPGSLVNVPELAPNADAIPISQYPKGNVFELGNVGPRERIPLQPAGSKMVLFLRRGDDKAVSNPGSSKPTEHWQPAGDDMKTSVLWLDRKHVFCFFQVMNPGPTALWPCSLGMHQMTALSLRTRIREVLQLQDELALVLRMKNNDQRAEKLNAIVGGDIYEARKEAIQGLGKCGPAAVPILRRIMDKPPIPYDSRDIFRAFVEAAGRNAGPELTAWLEQDVDFWETTGPTLKMGWWNEDAKPDAPLRVKYDETIQIIRSLAALKYRPAADIAKRLRDLWRSHPALNDPSGLNQMSMEATQLARELTKN